MMRSIRRARPRWEHREITVTMPGSSERGSGPLSVITLVPQNLRRFDGFFSFSAACHLKIHPGIPP